MGRLLELRQNTEMVPRISPTANRSTGSNGQNRQVVIAENGARTTLNGITDSETTREEEVEVAEEDRAGPGSDGDVAAGGALAKALEDFWVSVFCAAFIAFTPAWNCA